VPTASTVSVRGGKFRTVVREEGGGDPLLVLHDFDVQHDWEPYLSLLAKDFRVIAPLHPGYGDSVGIDHIDDPVDMAIYYADLLDALKVPAVHVLGIDLGAMFAIELAWVVPDRVKSMTLVGPVGLHADGLEVADVFAMDVKQVPALVFHDATTDVAKSHAPGRLDPDNVEEATVQQARAWSSATKFIWPFPEKGLEKRIHRVTAKTLLVWGANDRYVPPAFASAFQQALPGAQLVTIPDSGHFPNLEQPEKFGAKVRDFLKS
jgi:pimeloyl-ACP methyl ester carboxylesterase